jgi:hypothetical protein
MYTKCSTIPSSSSIKIPYLLRNGYHPKPAIYCKTKNTALEDEYQPGWWKPPTKNRTMAAKRDNMNHEV